MEVALIDGGDTGDTKSFGDSNNAGVGAAESEISVAVDENSDAFPVGVVAVSGGNEHAGVYDQHDQSRPNPSARISSASRALRPDIDAPIPANASWRLAGLSADLFSGSWVVISSRSRSGLIPRRAASALSLVASSSIVIAMTRFYPEALRLEPWVCQPRLAPLPPPAAHLAPCPPGLHKTTFSGTQVSKTRSGGAKTTEHTHTPGPRLRTAHGHLPRRASELCAI